jgi:hypothetical protein
MDMTWRAQLIGPAPPAPPREPRRAGCARVGALAESGGLLHRLRLHRLRLHGLRLGLQLPGLLLHLLDEVGPAAGRGKARGQ